MKACLSGVCPPLEAPNTANPRTISAKSSFSLIVPSSSTRKTPSSMACKNKLRCSSESLLLRTSALNLRSSSPIRIPASMAVVGSTRLPNLPISVPS